VKAILTLLLLVVGIAATGCGGSDARVSKLERRVAKLERENDVLGRIVMKQGFDQVLIKLRLAGAEECISIRRRPSFCSSLDKRGAQIGKGAKTSPLGR